MLLTLFSLHFAYEIVSAHAVITAKPPNSLRCVVHKAILSMQNRTPPIYSTIFWGPKMESRVNPINLEKITQIRLI